MDQQTSPQAETEGKGSIGKYVRTGVIILATALIVLTFVMAIYRKFGG
jgi:hypothetical protein